MESAPQSVSPQIQRVLKSFQTSANRTLQGPGGVVMLPNGSPDSRMLKLTGDDLTRKSFESRSGLNKEFEYMYRFNHQVQQLPVFTPADNSRSERTETLLENERIACFNVGGEKRLCLPQIFKTVLKDLELSEINAACDDLHIFCSRCQPEQLEILKLAGDLPSSAPSCGLITKTDAERLCNALLRSSGETPFSHPSPNCFKVYHECFGKCGGNFNPDAYTSPNAYCIQCTDCGFWLTPQKFVCHSHKSLENRTCHWGFDSSNWRCYVLLAKHQPGLDKLRDILEQVKSRFDASKKYKRKTQGLDTNEESVKRCRSEDAGSLSLEGGWGDSGSTLRAMMSAFQPWPPTTRAKDCKMLPAPPAIMREGISGTAPSFLHSGPPVLLHPDKVVPHSESSRYEPNYAPNVSLAPVQKCKGEDDEDDGDGEAERKSRVGSPEPAPSQPAYREWDLSESEDSSVEHGSPAQGEDSRLSPTTENQRALEIELEMIRQALDGKIGSNKEEKDRFLHEFCKLRSKHQEFLNRNIQARRNLKQELANAKACSRERYQEASEQQAHMEREMDKYRRDAEARLKEVKDDNAKLLKDVQIMQDRDEIGIGKIQELQGRLQQYEMIFQQLHVENIVMREKLHQMGVNVLDLTKGACNGGFSLLRSPSGSPPQRSPTEVPTPHLHPGYLHLLRAGILPLYSGVPPADRFIKKEHDGT